MKIKIFITMLNIFIAAGCAGSAGNTLVFGQHTTVGISLGGSPSAQGVDFTLGYKDQNIAIVPVFSSGVNGGEAIRSKAPGEFADHEDALSVLGQFKMNVSTDSADVGLGKFFATGLAAKALADGFSFQMAPADNRQSVEDVVEGDDADDAEPIEDLQ